MTAQTTGQLVMYTTSWCGFCRRLKSQLAREGIAMTEIDIERDPAAEQYVMKINNGNAVVPTLQFSDGSTLTNPSVKQVKRHLQSLTV